jgi:hypothetical protein
LYPCPNGFVWIVCAFRREKGKSTQAKTDRICFVTYLADNNSITYLSLNSDYFNLF